MGVGMAGGTLATTILALVVDEGGNVFAGGDFTLADGMAANYIARWDGLGWSSLGQGVEILGTSGIPTVEDLAVFDDESGPALYACGFFTHAGGVPAPNVARWDGATWSPLGSGLSNLVWALAVFDDGSGPALYAGGHFTTAGGIAANRVARWDGGGWSALGSGTSNFLDCLAVHDLGSGPALFAGGAFESSQAGDAYLARWGCTPSGDTLPPTIVAPSGRTVADRIGSAPGEIVTFVVRACDETDPSPALECSPPSGSLFPRGTTLVTCTATDSSGNVAIRTFPVTVEAKARRP